MKRFLGLGLIALSFVACNKDEDYSSVRLDFRTDIADAKMLALCGNGINTRSNPEDMDLFKIDANGNMRSVVWIVPETTDTVRLVPETILPLSDDFVLLVNTNAYSNNQKIEYQLAYGSYIVRKKDGAVFGIDRDKYPDFSYMDYSSHQKEGIDLNPRTDNFNNAYCLAGSGLDNIYKFALNSLDDITMQQINLEQFPVDIYSTSIHPYEVDENGNCITSADLEGNRTILYKSEGGMFEFPQSDGIFNYFVGYNGNLYCCAGPADYSSGEPSQYSVFPLEIGVQVSYDLENATSKKTETEYNRYQSKLYTLENGYIHVLLATDDTNNMLVYNSKDDTIKEVGFLPGTMEEVVGISNNCIYRIMEHQIYKYDFATDEKTVIPIDFDFNSCTIYKDWIAYNIPSGSKFILGAVRNSDMALLRIEVDMETGKATTFETMQDRPIVTLVQI